jgi:hypothetical protein
VVISDVMPREAASAVGSMGIAINWLSNFFVVSTGQNAIASKRSANPSVFVQGIAFLPVRDLLKGIPFGGVGNIFYLFSLFALCISLSLSRMYKKAGAQ